MSIEISFLLCLVFLQNRESYVFGLQTNLHKPRSIDSYVRYYFNKDDNSSSSISDRGKVDTMTQSTVCYRFWILQFRDILPFLSYAYSDKADNAFLFFQAVQALDFYYNDAKEYSDLVLDDTVEVWHHHCAVFTHPTYRIYVDGKLGTEGQLGVKAAAIPLNGSLYLGHDQDRYDGGRDPEQTLTGYISQVNIWDYPLDPSVIERVAKCKSNDRGNILSSDIEDLETSNVEINTVTIDHFCKTSSKAVIIPEQMYPDDANYFCRLVDARFYIPETQEENDRLKEESIKFSDKCHGKSYRLMYLGASDAAKEGVWTKMSDDRTISYTNWFPGEPNGGRKGNCIVLRRYDSYWGDVLCDNELCFSCSRTNKDYLQLRGLCQEQEHQTRFLLDGYVNSRPYFRGYYNLMIYHSGEKEWIIRDTHTNITLASLSLVKASEFPIGRRSWQIISPVCDSLAGSSIILGLSTCTTEEFMCSDGSCVHRSVRCNLRDDCLDRSDEENCTIVSFSDRYHDYRPPPGVSFGVPLKLSPVVDLIRFSKIDDIDLAFHMEIEVALVWIDRNLRFKNIKTEEGKNKLSQKEVEGIWTPEVEFLNVNDGQLQLLKSGVYIRQVGQADPPIFTDVKMDTIYQPASTRLVQRQQYYASFNCHFSLFRYPFDTQTCRIVIKLASADRNVIDLENATVIYSGMKQLPKYEVKNIGIEMKPRGGYAVMEVMFQLERRYSLLVLTVFMPTFLLLGIGYGTLFIKIKDFEVRSIMTLTTLLVLYTMFDQVSSDLPDTAYIKMVDLWFFFCIFVIFSIILVHVGVEWLPPGEDEGYRNGRGLFSTTRVSPIQGLNGGDGKIDEEAKFDSPKHKLTASRLLFICRTILYPAIVLLFGASFWIVIMTAENA